MEPCRDYLAEPDLTCERVRGHLGAHSQTLPYGDGPRTFEWLYETPDGRRRIWSPALSITSNLSS